MSNLVYADAAAIGGEMVIHPEHNYLCCGVDPISPRRRRKGITRQRHANRPPKKVEQHANASSRIEMLKRSHKFREWPIRNANGLARLECRRPSFQAINYAAWQGLRRLTLHDQAHHAARAIDCATLIVRDVQAQK